MFGVDTLPYWVSVLFSVFVCVSLINSFNLLDGIDGLASGMAIFISLVFGFWLYKLGFHNYAVLSVALTGGLIPFFIFNVFGKKNKLFMGDSGSLILGLLFSVLAMKILCCQLEPGNALYMNALPVVVMSVMIMPMFDTIRVFILRILRGKSPFRADKTHLHHIFLELGFNHLETSLTIILINMGLAFMTYLLRNQNPVLMVVILFGSAFIISMVPYYLAKYVYHRNGKAGINVPVH
jgi:UDP-N-acetylmuramyl pentapeptide phosphotransferase/UDP-N-acetylglucosamine-1-phosphate transferase